MKKEKTNNITRIHIVIILIGIVFILLSVFHSNLWFDEAYSVAFAEHTFSEIWTIGGNDVHPILYYWILHILNLIFKNEIIIYRVFSALCIAILGIIGYTHIRKDFGEKTGLVFSFLIYFLPVSSLYAGEIRMYSLGMLLGTLTAIYAYRIYKNNINKLTFIFFGLSSLAVAYTHYYGLMFTGIINLLLLIHLIKNIKDRKKDLIKYIITAIVQVIAYIPWLICFVTQLSAVSKGFWITLTFPGTLIEVLTTQFKGNLPDWIAVILSIIIYAYVVYIALKTKKEERKTATWCVIIYISIILIALLISLTMQSVILLYRYLLIITGPLVFAISFFMAKDEKKWRLIVVCSIIIVMSCISNISIMKENYNSENEEYISYIKNRIQEGDIICYSNAINGAVVTTQMSQECKNISYFYNKEHWGVEEAYKAFAPYMEIEESLSDILEEYTGRIWLIEGENTHSLLEEIDESYTINKIEEKQFKCTYRDYSYTVELIEKY